MTHPSFRDKGSKLYLPCGTRDRVCKSGTVPDVSGRLAAMASTMPRIKKRLLQLDEAREAKRSKVLETSSTAKNC